MPIDIDMSPTANYANPADFGDPSSSDHAGPSSANFSVNRAIPSGNVHPPDSMVFPFNQFHQFTPFTPFHNGPNPARRKPPNKRRRFTLETLYSGLYQASFSLFVLITTALLLGSVWGLGEEAWRTGGQKRWNIAFLVAAYVAIAIISIAHLWSRVLSIKRILATLPKPYLPTKQIDVPKKVANHIMTEYSRTAVIAHISQATKSQQEGWGRPGTKWENQHFRTHILNTLPMMTSVLCPQLTSPPRSLDSLLRAAEEVGDSGVIRLLVNSYANIIDRARYAGREPNEEDAMACDKLVEAVRSTMQVKTEREERERTQSGESRLGQRLA